MSGSHSPCPQAPLAHALAAPRALDAPPAMSVLGPQPPRGQRPGLDGRRRLREQVAFGD